VSLCSLLPATEVAGSGRMWGGVDVVRLHDYNTSNSVYEVIERLYTCFIAWLSCMHFLSCKEMTMRQGRYMRGTCGSRRDTAAARNDDAFFRHASVHVAVKNVT